MNMRIIPTRIHGVLDYATGGMLMAAPELLGLKDVPAAALVPRVAGSGAAAYSLATDYELGAIKVLPMKAHLAMDAASGVALAASPWLFGYAKAGRRYWLPYVAVGAVEVVAALSTKTQPSYRPQG